MDRCKLSVNINKIATIRNARGGMVPNVLAVAMDCEHFGADGITVHPRPDERHITLQDVYELSDVLTKEFNIEGYPDGRFMDILRKIRPAQATLVPDPPDVLTSNAGWDTKGKLHFLQDVLAEIKEMGIRTSIFVETDLVSIEFAQKTGTDRIELYTGPYAEQYSINRDSAIEPYIQAANLANQLGLGINAGHDLSLENLAFFNQNINGLLEVSIGHALISDALYFGLENTIQMYQSKLV
jgi:pyridoxine 5-phosphate synthase